MSLRAQDLNDSSISGGLESPGCKCDSLLHVNEGWCTALRLQSSHDGREGAGGNPGLMIALIPPAHLTSDSCGSR